ncbi:MULTISPECIES: DUF397 domain-containing protein [Nocardia]|uniref:DUF397 domain-containing protein n=1 Tax=Nocardia TaxID=1817 RepID=UPI001892E87C|nr:MULTISPECIES: DUF397 domain-containing protein [Nocardia]MBF6351091.1 DUF397 domain-containing protein [Nocardia flavorosea]
MTDLAAARWFKSRRSSGQQDCVEVAFLGSGTVGVRDSKNPTGPALTFGPAQWDGFVVALAANRFQR